MKWISVEDSLPAYYDYVLVYAKMPGTGEPCPISIARYIPEDCWEMLYDEQGAYMDMSYEISNDTITHWMTFPEFT